MQHYDVVVVGAGPAGIGLATMLAKLPDLDYTLLEGGLIGESLRRWPAQTRFITPSFYSNPFGALHCGVEHPSGAQYADYLSFVAQQHNLPIRENCHVQEVASAADGGFILSTEQGELTTRFLVWATGEYQFPELSAIPRGELVPTLCRSGKLGRLYRSSLFSDRWVRERRRCGDQSGSTWAVDTPVSAQILLGPQQSPRPQPFPFALYPWPLGRGGQHRAAGDCLRCGYCRSHR